MNTCLSLIPDVTFIRTMNQQITCKEDTKLNFGLCIKSIERATAPLFIGFSSLTLSTRSLGVLTKKCLIMNEDGNAVGSMLLKVEMSQGETIAMFQF